MIPAITAVITLIFTAVVFYRYSHRRGTHLLIWGISLSFYTLGVLSEAVLALTWSAFSPPVVLGGALVVAAWLGQGTVFLLVRKRPWPQVTLAFVIIGSAIGLIWIFLTPLNETAFILGESLTGQYKAILPPGGVRLMTPFFNIYGTITLIGSAIYSAWLFWRKRILLNRMWGNIFIALGGLSPGVGRYVPGWQPTYLYLSELLGSILIFIGFLLATAHRPATQKCANREASG
ncbi:MAG: hypothetical protein IPM76_20745 [Chloroflexi bacterium]|nr:hypothetical protein [Chloroflexota bacterium]